MEQSASLVCPYCKFAITPESYFCPNCGKELRSKPLTVSVGRQIGIYLLSFFLPPLGLYPGIKYIRQSNSKTKLVGWIAIGLTVVSIAISLYFYSQFVQQISSLSSQNMLNY